MITNEQHEEFLNNLDKNIHHILNIPSIYEEKDYIEFCVNNFNKIRNGECYPIIWVKHTTSIVKEFYSSELTLNWLVTYIIYYKSILNGNKDMESIYSACLFMYSILKSIKGINTVNGVTYILMKDVDFIKYKMDKKIFIDLSTTSTI